MFKWKYTSRRQAAQAEMIAPDEREEPRRSVFHDAVLTLEDFYNIRAIITDLGEKSARVQYATRRDLPFRIRISAPTIPLQCWARVVWQRDGAAGLDFLPLEEAPLR